MKNKLKTWLNSGEIPFRIFTVTAAMLIPIIMFSIIISLVSNSMESIHKFGWSFLSTNDWNPVIGSFGALASMFGTVISSLIAMLIAVPASFLIALFLVEIAPKRLKTPVRYGIETLAAIPSIIYGMWGLFVIAPLLADHVQPFLTEHLGFIPLFDGPPMGIGMLNAGIVLALMILPYMTSVMRDVFSMVPGHLREAVFGMGATTWEVVSKITVRYSFKGMMGALFLGLGRAVGETMAITFVIGNDHSISSSLFMPATTIASTLANEFTEASENLYLSSLFELGLILLAINIIVVVVGELWIKNVSKGRGK